MTLVASCGDDDGHVGDGGPDGAIGDAGPASCGNNDAEGTELCDGRDLRGLTCASATQGVMSGGMLRCNDDCTFDIGGCYGDDDAGFEDDGGMGGTGG